MKKQVKSKTLERALWEAADKLRKNMDASEYKHAVLGLIFLRHISEACETLRKKLDSGMGKYEGADPEDIDEYRAENVFFVPPGARWDYLQNIAREPSLAKTIDLAMDAVEDLNPSLKGVLPRDYARLHLDNRTLGQLIDLVGSIAPDETRSGNGDLLGRVYEYFLGEFAAAEGKKGGQFYTPAGVVKLLVELLEPYRGKVYDPCCGSGGMFVQSETFVLAHRGRLDDITVYGQESNPTTHRLCRMNLAIRGIDASYIKWNFDGSFLDDAHPYLTADTILANPPFNDSDWGRELLIDDPRWAFGAPPSGNANFAWLQHIVSHLAPDGYAGVVLSNGSLSSQTRKEGSIRAELVRQNMVDCIVALPDRLFYNTGIPACIWILTTAKSNRNPAPRRRRREEILFIDAGNLGRMINRRNRVLREEDIRLIADIYHNWRREGGEYADVEGRCKSVTLDETERNRFILTPARYVGVPRRPPMDAETFDRQLARLEKKFTILIKRGAEMDHRILESLKEWRLKP